VHAVRLWSEKVSSAKAKIVKIGLYVILAIVVAYIFMYFENPRWNPFNH
jgi:hypothetical protein